MNDFYQNFLTDKSFLLLKKFHQKFNFILIGGWAVYFYTHSLKSKDIDIIIDFSQLAKFKKEFALEKNERLKKYQIKIEEIDIDIYLPFYSYLGISVEKIIKKTEVVNGFVLLQREILALTKLYAFQNRKGSAKGQKDLIDIIGLILLEEFNWDYFLHLIRKNRLGAYLKTIKDIFKKTRQVEELNLNKHYFAKKKKEVLAKVADQEIVLE